jgi:hypothetical protein
MTSQEEKKPRRVELTERDIDTLRFIGEQYAAGLDQLQRVLGSQAGPGVQQAGRLSESAMRVWVARMKAVGAIEQAKPFNALPAFVWLRPAGLQLAGLGYKYLKPALTTLNHLYWCNEVRLFLAQRRPGESWIPERQLRSEHAQAATARQRERLPDIPDAHLMTANGPIAVEVDITDKQQARLDGIIARRAAQYFTVWYFCSPETKPLVERAKAKLSAQVQPRVSVYDLYSINGQQPKAKT